ncbi:asparaginase [Congregibacter variabilis]|uniref:Asparaginase n=1 Tax=Congregibacter variabilis TaxID=3081200 RepID=A0ABZ0HZF5_9GAMM|nr:asparaginase [Congregibacter sp. IMCC43200]
MKTTIVLVLLLCAGLVAAKDGATTKPRVLILTTGGTIASRSDAPLIRGPELVQAVPQLLDYAQVSVEEFSVIGSSKVTPDHWLRLARRINEIFASDEQLAGIVITHGTDTLEETAYFLNLTVQSKRPVVLVGSMRSSNEVSADGPANLINAVRVAISDEAIGQGILVAMNEDISAARDVWKTDNRRVQTFDGVNVGHLGAVDPDGVRFYHRSLQPHTLASEFDVSAVSTLPTVLVLSDFTGLDEAVVKHFGELPMDGLVVRTFAGGRMSAGMLAGLSSISRRGIPIVVTSRVPKGRIVSAPDYPFSAIVSRGQQDNKARILLMLALTKTTESEAIQGIFNLY